MTDDGSFDIKDFIKQFDGVQVPSAAEEREMLLVILTPPKSAKGKDSWNYTPKQKKVREEFLSRNMRLVVHTTKRFCKIDDPRILDFIQAGVTGMAHALDTFDLDREVRFSTYAAWWIRAKMSNEVKLHDTKPRRYKTQYADYRKIFNQYIKDRKFPTDEEIFAELKWDEEKVRKFYEDQERLRVSIDSLGAHNCEFNTDDSSLTIDAPQDAILEQMHNDEVLALLSKAMNVLSPEERVIIERHFALGKNEKATYDRLAVDLELTRERVRQIENHALKKLYRYFDLKAPSVKD